jgi:glycerol-3-phosphate dehydrogenase (NAD+)
MAEILHSVWELEYQYLSWQDAVLQAMNGTLSLEDALNERLQIIDCKPQDLARFLEKYPPHTRLSEVCNTSFTLWVARLLSLCYVLWPCKVARDVQGIGQLVAALQVRGIAVYLISGGFRCKNHRNMC